MQETQKDSRCYINKLALNCNFPTWVKIPYPLQLVGNSKITFVMFNIFQMELSQYACLIYTTMKLYYMTKTSSELQCITEKQV